MYSRILQARWNTNKGLGTDGIFSLLFSSLLFSSLLFSSLLFILLFLRVTSKCEPNLTINGMPFHWSNLWLKPSQNWNYRYKRWYQLWTSSVLDKWRYWNYETMCVYLLRAHLIKAWVVCPLLLSRNRRGWTILLPVVSVRWYPCKSLSTREEA